MPVVGRRVPVSTLRNVLSCRHVRSDDAGELTLADGIVDIVERLQAAEADADPASFEKDGHRALPMPIAAFSRA